MEAKPKRNLKYKIVYVIGDVESDVINSGFAKGAVEMNCIIHDLVFSNLQVAIGYMTCIVHNKTSDPYYLHASKEGKGYLAIGVCDATNVESDEKLEVCDVIPFVEEIPETLKVLDSRIRTLEEED